MKDYVVYTKKLARSLINEGFELKNTAVDNNNPKFNVYYFENTQELQNAIKRLTKR